MAHRFLTPLSLAVLFAVSGFSASYVVPRDRDFVREASVIVIGSALASHTELNDRGGIETMTDFSIEEVVKGSVERDSIVVVEPGGVYKDRAAVFPGTPRFNDGERYLLFLMKIDDGHWHVLDLALGSFHFATDVSGHRIVLRDLADSAAFEPTGGPHREANRAAEPFLDFIRATAIGGPANENYALPAGPLLTALPVGGRLMPVSNTTITAQSYTMDLGFGDTHGGRWTSFPVTFHSIGSEPGAPANSGQVAGSTAITTAFNAWNTAPSASINYVYAGNDASNTTNAPGAAGDGKNTIAFEYNLSACCGIGAFTCNSTSYSGVLGLGGVSQAGTPTTTTPDGSILYTITEGDVWMNQGIANCALLITPGDFNSAVTHEAGHSLGFRHSDQNRLSTGACGTDAIAEECTSTTAIMKSFVELGVNAALQPYDQHAAALVYPAPTAPPAVSGVSATATAATTVHIFWSGGCSSVCHVYRTADRVSWVQVGSPAASPFDDTTAAANTAYLYKIRAFNGTTESADSPADLATTVIYTDDPLGATTTAVKALHLTQVRTAVNAVRGLAGVGQTTFTDPSPSGVTIKAVHINELRTALDAGMAALGSVTGGYTNTITANTSLVHAIDLQEIRNRVK